MFGKARYGEDFPHFSYVNPNAPKGGHLRLSALGTFDSLNPFVPIGVAAFGLRQFVYESLMTRSLDEPFTLYGLLAKRVEMAPDRRSITFYLNPKARFSNGEVVRVEDVIFSAKTLRAEGLPNHRLFYNTIAGMKKIGTRAIRFTFTSDANWETPLLIGLMPILSKKFFTKNAFAKSRTLMPVGSGPYQVAKAEWGKRLVYQRNKNYWGSSLPVARGRFNFDRLEINYFRDESARFAAFQKGTFDFFEESSPTRWAKAYRFPLAEQGKIKKHYFTLKVPAPMWSIALNSRRSLFQNKTLRRALALTFDHQWMKKNLFFGLWQRHYSFWARTSLAGQTKPPAALSLRARRRQAFALFAKEGWEVKNNQLTKNGKPFAFTLLVRSRLNERIALVWQQQLKAFGVKLAVRFVDSSQYERRRQQFDYDALFATWFMSLSPGNEQYHYWSRRAAKTPASRNYPGVRLAAVDRQLARITKARTYSSLQQATQKLDALLLEGHYVIPLFFAEKQWLAIDKTIGFPEKESYYGFQIDTWWKR